MGAKTYLMMVTVVAVIAIVAGYMIFNNLFPTTSSVPLQKNFFLSLTDPATVPQGTTALFVTYSALQLQISHSGGVSTQTLPGSGTVNVLSLQNSSIVLASTNVLNGSKVTQIKINISNAIITIGGENYTVVIGERTLTINVTSNNSISGQKNALVDLIPSVTAIETVDKTVYVLTANVRAVITPPNIFLSRSSSVQHGIIQSLPPVGSKVNFSSNVSLGKLFNNVTPTINVTSASISIDGNYTNLSVTVKNTGNDSVQLNGIMINGLKKVYFPQPPMSELFRLPSMIMQLPITPPAGVLTPSGFIPPPKMVITFPNGTIMNTTSTFTLPSIPTRPPINSTNITPSISTSYINKSAINSTNTKTSNSTGYINNTNSTVSPNSTNTKTSNSTGYINSTNSTVSLNITLNGTFYFLKIVTPAHAISLNSTGALVNVSGDIVYKTTTMPQFTHTIQQNGSQQGPALNVTIPAGATAVTLPVGTTLYIQFPAGMAPPTVTPPPQITLQAAKFPIGRMIFPNGTLGFPPMYAMSTKVVSNSTSANGAALNTIANGATNTNVTINPDQIPKGYTLMPGDSITFTLSGLLNLGPSQQVQSDNGVKIPSPFAVLISGDSYSINLFGKIGAHAETVVTAS